MNISVYLQQPDLITTLTPQQKLELFQQLQKHLTHLQQEKVRIQTQLEMKQKEQQDLFTELQTLTNLHTLPEIQQHLTHLQQQFDQQLLDITKEFSQL